MPQAVSTLSQARQRVSASVELAHTVCVHPQRYYDRFGDDVCTECHEVIEAGAVEPNAGLESASAHVVTNAEYGYPDLAPWPDSRRPW